MIEPVFETLRRAMDLNIQMQQEVFKKWFSLGPGLLTPPAAATEQVEKVKKEWTDFMVDLVKKQRGALESQFSTGLQIIEETFHLTDAKDPEELRAKTVELWQKGFDSQRQLYESQLRDFQTVIGKWTELVTKQAPKVNSHQKVGAGVG